MKPVVAITIGDYNGIGPEVTLLAATDARVRKVCTPVLVGPLEIYRATAASLKKRITLDKAVFPALPGKGLHVVDVGDGLPMDVTPGTPTKGSGRTTGQALEHAIQLCVARKVTAMVTGPASKDAMHMAGYTFPGQTELVTMFSRSQRVLMMLVSAKLRVGLVTAHTPVRDIPSQITADKLEEKLRIMHESLVRDFGLSKPSIAVLGLNPHAGEAGRIGREEQDIIAPALSKLSGEGIRVSGPYPADGFFGSGQYKSFDGVMAMYHDQGLVPLKLLSFGSAVNVSAGLSIIRTSPDHGTAYDIAGKRKADPSSTIQAVLTAVTIAKNRARS